MKCHHCGTNLGELTNRQRDCAELLLEGYQEKEMAKELGISFRTVKHYMAQMFHRYGIHDGNKRIKLAVTLYYERNPHMRVATDIKLSPTERFILLNGGGQ